mgnify:CR=1 FL=1
MIDDVYNARILDFAGNIPMTGTLEDADAEAQAHSKLCGSKVKVWLKMDGDRVSGFAHDVKACALGQASSAIMAANVIGLTEDELADLERQMTAMLKEEGPPPARGTMQRSERGIALGIVIISAVVFSVRIGRRMISRASRLISPPPSAPGRAWRSGTPAPPW